MFNLRVSLPNIDQSGTVQSDLRVAILKALGEAGIDIPFNQVDINLRDLDMIKRYLDDVLAVRPNGAGRSGRPPGATSSPTTAAGEAGKPKP